MLYQNQCAAAQRGVNADSMMACILTCSFCDPDTGFWCDRDFDNIDTNDSGQTFGTVASASDPYLEDVDVRLHHWPPPIDPDSSDNLWEWPVQNEPPPSYATTTSNGPPSSKINGNYVFDRYTGICRYDGAELESVESERWYRTKLTKTDFEPYFNYRFHRYDDACEADDWGGHCSAISCVEPGIKELQCVDWGPHEMHGVDEPHHRRPDLIVDPRPLQNDLRVECAYKNEGDADPTRVALRVSGGVANVGAGELRVERLRPGADCPDDSHCPLGSGDAKDRCEEGYLL